MQYGVLIISVIAFLLGLTPTDGVAQTLQSPTAEKIPVEQITQEMREEAQIVYHSCVEDPAGNDFDCDCLAAYTLDARRNHDSRPRYDVLRDFYRKCLSKEDIAGSAYLRCKPMAEAMGLEVEAFCTCYANTFANMEAKSTLDHPRYVQKRMSSAMTECGFGNYRAKALSPEEKQQLEDIQKLRSGEELAPQTP